MTISRAEWGVLLCAIALGCSRGRPSTSDDDAEPIGGSGQTGGASSGQPGAGGVADIGGAGGRVDLVQPSGPVHHPPPGFENCIHAEVKKDCRDGWCKLPSSCFVIGSPEDEWKRGRITETQMAAILTHEVELQQTEMTRLMWKNLFGATPASDDELACQDDDCPATNLSWWDAVYAANELSSREGLEPCYLPRSCDGAVGNNLSCEGVSDPEGSIHECRGYRLPTRAEAEFAARAGTISAFYSGSIAVQEGNGCSIDSNLDLIAWYCSNARSTTHPVARLRSNDFGIFDLLGNAGEHVNDEDSYAASPGGVNPESSVGTSDERVRYGGDVRLPAFGLRAASRLGLSWSERSDFVGFRLYRTLFEDSERSGPIVEE
jgi:sulfatase modifying factor 1